MKLKTIQYIVIYILLLATAFVGCSETEIPIQEDDLVAIELVGLNGSVQVTRAGGIDPSLTTIHNATIIVFHADTMFQRRTIDYAAGERVFLKRGGTYKVFVIANLDDANCPDDFTTATYFDDVEHIDDLNSKYFISSTAPGIAPVKMPMISGSSASPFEVVTINKPPQSTTVTLQLRSLYTKVEVSLYNLVNDGAGNSSGVELLTYYANNLPTYSWLVERPTTNPNASDDYPQTLTPTTIGYDRSSLVDIRVPDQVHPGSRTYARHSFVVYCLENRRGTVTELTADNVFERKAKAPKFAFEVNFQGNANEEDVLQTYVVIGKGHDENYVTQYGNFDIERNCIYQVQVYIDGVTNVKYDSRRMYLNVVISGDLEFPGDGQDYEF
ncbi:hypothetical protein LJC57_02370 [Parabacteroides sp. OttesenSCG-928-G07]|nr:hypothetical protein [Parabacteroides sp. OttesenSCG-928-G21]MDL2277414.1 hypothetical protein [Parabacteroides sp. OttesenSCG-928-G07]